MFACRNRGEPVSVAVVNDELWNAFWNDELGTHTYLVLFDRRVAFAFD